MKLIPLAVFLTVALSATGCEGNMQTTGNSGQEATMIDSARAAKATAVLRVTFLKNLGGDKYSWDQVKVLKVLKGTGVTEGSTIEIAHVDRQPGIPAGESTVYLVPYAEDSKGEPWLLLDGSAEHGVSHAKQ